MRKTAGALALILALLCVSCTPAGPGSQEQEGTYALYFAVAPGGSGSPAERTDGAVLDIERRALPEGSGEVEGLLSLLFAGPEREDLVSPFPPGVMLLGWEKSEGTLSVDLSEAYGGLSGVGLTLADGCVVLTLCQLPGVEAVYFTVEGRARPFRDQVFTPEEFLLDNALEEVSLPEGEGDGLERSKTIQERGMNGGI